MDTNAKLHNYMSQNMKGVLGRYRKALTTFTIPDVPEPFDDKRKNLSCESTLNAEM